MTGNMRTAVIIGGAGEMGRWAVRGIARLGSVDRLIIADLNVDRARQLAEEVGGPCEAMRLDATDHARMREVFAECDIVLNTMGPFTLFARGIVEAAIESGCDYLDIDDDWQSTVEAREFDEAAKKAGVVVLKGIGGSPGVSNLMAAVAASRLDEVDTIVTGWSMRGAVLVPEEAYPSTEAPGAAVEHLILQASGTIRGWRDGAPSDTMPLETLEFDYPGIGPVRTHAIGHPEAVTLPQHFTGLTAAVNVTSGPDWVFDRCRELAAAYDAGEITLAEAAHRFENTERPATRGARDPLERVWAAAYGRKDGHNVGVAVEPTAHAPGMMGGGTGNALAAGVEYFVRGLITAPGVHFPEQVIDPLPYFEILATFLEKPTSVDEYLAITEADDVRPPRLAP